MKAWNLTSGFSPFSSLLEALTPFLGHGVKRIAAVGSGGKTTLLDTLSGEFRSRDQRVLLLPTTHMLRPEKDGVFTGKALDAIAKLERDGFAVAGLPVPENPQKIGFPGWETYELAGARAQVVLMEADGSRRLPLKFPSPHEPLLPADVDLILAVTGMSALGRPPKEVCHRYPLALSCLQKEDWTCVLPEELFLLQTEGYLKPLRKAFPRARVIPVWNQADRPKLAETAFHLLAAHKETEALVTTFL